MDTTEKSVKEKIKSSFKEFSVYDTVRVIAFMSFTALCVAHWAVIGLVGEFPKTKSEFWAWVTVTFLGLVGILLTKWEGSKNFGYCIGGPALFIATAMALSTPVAVTINRAILFVAFALGEEGVRSLLERSDFLWFLVFIYYMVFELVGWGRRIASVPSKLPNVELIQTGWTYIGDGVFGLILCFILIPVNGLAYNAILGLLFMAVSVDTLLEERGGNWVKLNRSLATLLFIGLAVVAITREVAKEEPPRTVRTETAEFVPQTMYNPNEECRNAIIRNAACRYLLLATERMGSKNAFQSIWTYYQTHVFEEAYNVKPAQFDERFPLMHIRDTTSYLFIVDVNHDGHLDMVTIQPGNSLKGSMYGGRGSQEGVILVLLANKQGRFSFVRTKLKLWGNQIINTGIDGTGVCARIGEHWFPQGTWKRSGDSYWFEGNITFSANMRDGKTRAYYRLGWDHVNQEPKAIPTGHSFTYQQLMQWGENGQSIPGWPKDWSHNPCFLYRPPTHPHPGPLVWTEGKGLDGKPFKGYKPLMINDRYAYIDDNHKAWPRLIWLIKGSVKWGGYILEK